jgi:NADPH:quinone reductase-like Zn-dependent oxidoreductase
MNVGSTYDAMVLSRPGEALVREQRSVHAPAEGEVIVRITASSLNYHDALAFGKPVGTFPRVPLSDGCGEVVALGARVSRFALGDRVLANIFTDWSSGPPNAAAKAVMLGDQIDGCLRQVATWPAEWLVPAPAHLTDLEAASIPAAGVTAWRALVVETDVRPGDRVVIQGTGGVAMFAIQIAKLRGATVIVTSSSDEKLERAKIVGADHTINYVTTPAWDDAVIDATQGEGAEVVLDMGGAATFGRSLRAARHGGTVLPIGVLSGYELSVPAGTVIAKDLRIQGMSGGNRDDLAAMCRALHAAGVHPVVDQHVGFGAVEKGLELLKLGRHVGKIGVKID